MQLQEQLIYCGFYNYLLIPAAFSCISISESYVLSGISMLG